MGRVAARDDVVEAVSVHVAGAIDVEREARIPARAERDGGVRRPPSRAPSPKPEVTTSASPS
jgi:hypothetical protein